MRVKILDGKNTIGGTKILVEINKQNFFLDYGRNFKEWGKFFEEFISPRQKTGIFDLWRLNLIPKFSGIYREDLILKEFKREINRYPKLEISAVLLSHAHLDHSGFISLLSKEIPIVSDRITEMVLKAYEETGQATFYNELQFLKIKEEKDGKLESVRNLHKERTFLYPEEGEIAINGIKIKIFPVDHSVPGAVAFGIETERGWIVYTGDIRFHGKNKETSKKFVRWAKNVKPYLLITEGTRAGSTKEKITEDDVYNSSMEVIKKNEGKLIIADFGPRNIERLLTFFDITKDSKRKFVVLVQDAYLMHLLKDTDENFRILNDEGFLILDEKRSDKLKWIKEMKKLYSNKFIKMEEIGKNPGDFVLCFSIYNLKNLLDIDLKDGVYIYSSSEAYTEEQAIDMVRLKNWLDFFNISIYGFDIDESGVPVPLGKFHASGHAPFEDILWMINEIQPENLMPVHTERLDLFYKNIRNIKIVDEI